MPGDLRDHVGGQRHHLEIVDPKQPGAQAVVDVMGVIGDIVGDRRDLRFERRKAPELQVIARDVVGNRRGNAVVAIASDGGAAALGQRAVVLDDALPAIPRSG